MLEEREGGHIRRGVGINIGDEGGKKVFVTLTSNISSAPNYYMGRGEWIYAYIGMVDVDASSG